MNKEKIEQAIKLLQEAIQEDKRLPSLLNKKKGYKPTPEQEERWKKIPPTKKTKELLKKKGYSDVEITHIKTQWDASEIINNLTSENI